MPGYHIAWLFGNSQHYVNHTINMSLNMLLQKLCTLAAWHTDCFVREVSKSLPVGGS